MIPLVFNELTKMSALPNFKSDITMQRDSEEDNRILIPITDLRKLMRATMLFIQNDKKQFYQPLLKLK